MLLWDRSAAVSFGPRCRLNEGIKVIGLRIAFEIEKTSESLVPNTGRISIYNLHPKHWAMLESGERSLAVILEAGYGGNLEELFVGDIKKAALSSEDTKNVASVTVTSQGPDTVTIIEAASGSKAMEAIIDKSYAEGTDLKIPAIDLVQTMRDTGGIMINGVLDFLRTGSFAPKKAQTGLVLSGSSALHLDNLTGALGLEWSIQDNDMQMMTAGGKTTEEAVLLTPKTGLIGSPVRREEGIEFTALIQPKIRPGRAVRIESARVTGNYRVNKAKFTGDTHDNAWYVTAEAK
ncbi:MAG: hypothetical protein AB1847_21450 [bacterium]